MSGFHNADITKGLLIGVAITSLTASLLDVKPYLHLQLVPHITKYHQFFRIAIHPLAFANSTELLVGLLALSSAGITVERAFGSRKYAAFLLLSSALSTFLALCALVLGHGLCLRYIPGGPYGILFSLLWQRHRLTPPVYTFRMMGVDFSPKTFSYILVSQLLLSDPPASLLAASTGLLTGYIYNLSALPLPGTPFTRRRLLRPLKAYRLPSSIHTLLGRIFGPILGTAAPPRRAYRIIPGQINESQLRAQAGALSQLINGQMGLGGRASAAAGGTTAAQQQETPRTGVQTRPGGITSPTPTNPLTPAPQPGRTGAAGARAAMGEWVSELAGRGGARAPTEEEISTLSNMFPTIGRDRIVRALQRNDYNTAQAVEALLEEST